jgi:acyl-CoA thioester hydrolase
MKREREVSAPKSSRKGSDAGSVSAETRVRYAETDQMAVAYYANYLTWFEIGRTEYLRTAGFAYSSLEKQDLFLPVLETFCRYHGPARYDDRLRIETCVEEMSRVKIKFRYSIYHAESEKLLATGYTVHGALDRAGRVRRIPEEIRAGLAERAVSPKRERWEN